MIISASRRTDIPSYFGKWFVNRLKAGFVLIQNPYNALRLSKVLLSPDITDCIVFWTKNPAPMFNELDQITDLGYHYYFQYTLTPYGETWEHNLPSIEKRIESFYMLAEKLGKHRIVWRYDPIILNDTFSVQYHIEKFSFLCEKICHHADECIISFVDSYFHNHNIVSPISYEQMQIIGQVFSKIARSYSINLSTCAEKIDLQQYGIGHASCIDKKRIEKIVGCPIASKKDSGQRPECGCIESIDVGTYETCLNGCKYCYATKNPMRAKCNIRRHEPDSPMLIGRPNDDMIITEKKVNSLKATQMSFL